MHAFNSSAQEAEAGGSLRVQGQSGLHSETSSQQDKTKSQQNQLNKNTAKPIRASKVQWKQFVISEFVWLKEKFEGQV